MIRKWYEISCDTCGSTEHFGIGIRCEIQARHTGWIISKYGHFCDENCKRRKIQPTACTETSQ